MVPSRPRTSMPTPKEKSAWRSWALSMFTSSTAPLEELVPTLALASALSLATPTPTAPADFTLKSRR